MLYSFICSFASHISLTCELNRQLPLNWPCNLLHLYNSLNRFHHRHHNFQSNLFWRCGKLPNTHIIIQKCTCPGAFFFLAASDANLATLVVLCGPTELSLLKCFCTFSPKTHQSILGWHLQSSSSSWERIFSVLKRVKRYLRSTLSQIKLNFFVLLYIEQDELRKLDKVRVIDVFTEIKLQKRNI